MEPITLSLLGGGIFYLLDRVKEKKEGEKQKALLAANAAASQAPRLPNPPTFQPAQIEKFTCVQGEVRSFDRQFAEALPKILESYSAVPVDLAELSPFGRCWNIVPKTPGAAPASELLGELLRTPGASVLGSLTLALPIMSPHPKILFAGSKGTAERFAPRRGSPFAKIASSPSEESLAAAAAAAAATAAAVAVASPPAAVEVPPAIVEETPAIIAAGPEKRAKKNGVNGIAHKDVAPSIEPTLAPEP